MAYHAPDREHGCCDSHAAALQTSRHAYDERVRQPIQRVYGRSCSLPTDQEQVRLSLVIGKRTYAWTTVSEHESTAFMK